MLYAKVVLGLPLEGPFDYSVPLFLRKNIKSGARVWIEFGNKKRVGYVVRFSKETHIQRVKPVLEIIDESPLIDENMLSLTKELARYYGCSWGEAIEAALPDTLRRGKEITNNIEERKSTKLEFDGGSILVHDLNAGARWDIYTSQIKQALTNNKSVIFLLPDINSVFKARERICASLGISPLMLYRKQPKEMEEWLKVKKSESAVALGTRSSIFAPVNNLGLIIIDEEQDTVYKQDQVPHYHAREVAFMRSRIEKAKLILGSGSPSLESFYLARRRKIKYMLLPRVSNYPEVKIIDMRVEHRYSKPRNIVLSKYLQDAITQVLGGKGKVLLFLNRKGFATSASCRNCGRVLKCPRCNINLVFYFKDNILSCRYCNFKMEPPKICPNCNSAYIRYLGAGTEKIESEISRIFPQARIARLDNGQDMDINSADIFISTSSIFKRENYNFGLIGTISIDNSLNRVDLRSTEKAFDILSGLLALTDKKLVIQTNLPKHYCLKAIESKDPNIFYEEELNSRRELDFPPYKHLCLVKLRGKKEENVKEKSTTLFDKINKHAHNNKSIKIVFLNPAQPAKLRGNFYWQILVKGNSSPKVVNFLKLQLKNFRHSGIIVTVDMDPI